MGVWLSAADTIESVRKILVYGSLVSIGTESIGLILVPGPQAVRGLIFELTTSIMISR